MSQQAKIGKSLEDSQAKGRAPNPPARQGEAEIVFFPNTAGLDGILPQLANHRTLFLENI